MRPRLEIEKEPIDHALELAGIIGVIVMMALPLYYWSEIPAIVPTHFNSAGQPDSYGSRWTAFILPLIGSVLFFGLLWLNRFPHKFNYAQNITKENAPRQYRMSTRLIRVVGALVAVSFAYLTYTVIQTSLGAIEGPGKYFVAIFAFTTLVVPIGYLLMSSRSA